MAALFARLFAGLNGASWQTAGRLSASEAIADGIGDITSVIITNSGAREAPHESIAAAAAAVFVASLVATFISAAGLVTELLIQAIMAAFYEIDIVNTCCICVTPPHIL
ncbi:hypothetical protein MY4824_009867 [Beauveria thailandica]